MDTFHENQVPWPADRPTTQSRKPGPFRTSMSDACERIEKEVSAFTRSGASWRTRELWIYADGKLGARNRFLANQPGLKDPRVAVSFDLDGVQYQIVADRYNEPWQNLAGIAEYIKAIRAQERNGIFTAEEMMATFASLPPSTAKRWFAECKDMDDAQGLYRNLVKEHHPDTGGDAETMAEISAAYEACKQELGL